MVIVAIVAVAAGAGPGRATYTGAAEGSARVSGTVAQPASNTRATTHIAAAEIRKRRCPIASPSDVIFFFRIRAGDPIDPTP